MPRPASSTAPASQPRLTLLAALAVALFWAVEGIDVNAPQVERVAILLASMALAWMALRDARPAAALTGGLAIAVAISERLAREPFVGSDVLVGTRESLELVANGGNPYATCLETTVPPCSPFVYPPGELAWYAVPQALFGDITRVDTWAGVAIVAALVLAGWRVGSDAVALPAMLYAGWGVAGYRSVDGANDVSASALAVFACVALVFAMRRGRPSMALLVLSAALFGWAMAFKQFTVLVFVPVARAVAVAGLPWRRYVTVAFAVVLAFVLPFFVRDPGAFLATQLATVTFHHEIWGTNLLATVQQYRDVSALVPLATAVQTAGALAFVVVIVRVWRPSSLGAAVLVGAGLVLFALLLAKWTSQPYYAYVGGIVACGLALISVSTRRDSGAPSPPV